ncbi:MAG: Gmad2 immunoglobulin-like domain-containing protein [Nocardioides sp.]
MTDDPRLDPHHDARLSELISQTADSIEPGDGLTAIRSRTRDTKETPMSSSKNWMYAVAGTAAVIVAVAAASQIIGDDGGGSTPVASSTKSSKPTPKPTPTESATDTPTPADSSATSQPVEGPVPVYYAGDGPRGTVLYREFQPGIGMDPVAQAAMAAVAGPAQDPDYRTLWPSGTQAQASYDGDVITVDLTGADLHGRPSGMTARDADLAVQQLVYSVQGAAQARAGVQLLLDGQHSDQVLGVPASEPLTNAKPLDVLSQMSITNPVEGQKITGGTLEADGVNNSFEATVAYEFLDANGQSVAGGAGMASGWGEEKLFPWKLSIDVSGLAPGTYTFVAKNDDPSGGEGKGPDTDTRTIVVE